MRGVILPVKDAETGQVISVELASPFAEDSVTELRYQLSTATGIPVEDQILLIGPPYKQLKRLDPPLVFSSSSKEDDDSRHAQLGTRSIFLYNRQTLDERSSPREESRTSLILPDLPAAPRDPVPPALLAATPSAASSSPGASSSWPPLWQALRQYERLCALNVAVGHTYVERARCALEGGMRCVEEQRIQRDAGEVALANLLDHLNAITRDGHDLLQRHAAQADKHRALLDATDNAQLRAKLESRALHPALVSALTHALSSSSSSSSSPSGADATMQAGLSACAGCAAVAKAQQPQPHEREAITLLDCVPAKRVKDWHRECVSTCERLSAWMSELRGALEGLQDRAEQQKASFTQAVPSPPVVDVLKRQVGEQERAVAALERGYRELMERVVACGGGTEEVVEVCQWVEGLLNRQAGVMAEMEGCDHDMLTHVRTVVKRKSLVTRWLAGTLLSISRLQSEMASLRADVAMGEQALDAERRHLGQLDHLDRLVAAYDAMLLELTRRRAYANLFETKVKAALHDLGTVREAEVAARQHFLSHHAPHLVAAMPVIQHFVFPLATMQDRPPHFHARALTLTEHTLPHVNVLADDDDYRRQDRDIGTTPGGGDEKLMSGYIACLSRARETDPDDDRLLKGEGSSIGKVDASRNVIMPACVDGDGRPSQAELEQKCLAQEVQIAELKAQVQTLQRAAGKATQVPMTAPEKPPVGTPDKEVKVLQEENESLRSGMSTIMGVMEDLRRAVLSVAGGALSSPRPQRSESADTPVGSRGRRGVTAVAGGGSGTGVSASAGAKPQLGGGGWSEDSATAQRAVDVVDDVADVIRATLRRLETVLQNTSAELDSRSSELTGLQNSITKVQSRKISFCEFNVGDVALFLPTSHQGENRVYLAFHMNCPHRYLSHESLESIRAGGRGFPDFILGKIVYIETCCAREDPRTNPYYLQTGTIYYVLHVSLDCL